MKNLGVKVLGVLVTLIMLLQTSVVLAASQSELKNQQSEVNSQIEDKKEELEEIKTEKSQTMSEVENLTNKITNCENQIDDINSQIDAKQAEIQEAEEKVKEKQADYEKNKKLAEERLVVMQESGETSTLDLILNAGSVIDAISSYYFIAEIAEADMGLLDKIEQEQKEIEEAKSKLEASKKELDTAKAQKQGLATQLQSAKSEKNAQVAKLSADEKATQAEIDELVSHEASIKSEIARMKAEYDRKMKEQQQQQNNNKGNGNSGSNSSSGSSGGSNSNSGSSSYGFGWPVSNPGTIGTKYGASGPMWSSGYHTGVDFRVGTGTPIYSIGDGQVFDTGYNSAYGNFVEIYHGNNIYSFYAHASSVNVRKGQTVSKGQKIMSSGATGNVSGPHLHFEIRTPGYKYSNCVNPMPYLP